MKNLKYSILLILTSLISINVSAYDYCIDGIFYNKITDNELAVTSEYDNYYSDDYNHIKGTKSYVGNITIPESVVINDKTFNVTTIGKGAFDSCSSLNSVTIPNSVTTIEDYAFENLNITFIELPNSVSIIGKYAFSGSRIVSMKLPPKIETIDEYCFDSCTKLEIIELPANLKEIKTHAFAQCVSLKQIIIPNSVISITGAPFYGCSSLKEATVDCSTISSEGIFFTCKNLTTLTLSSHVSDIHGLFFEDLPALNTLWSLNPNPPTVEIFTQKISEDCVLYVLEGCMDSYKSDRFWGRFRSIEEIKYTENTPEQSAPSQGAKSFWMYNGDDYSRLIIGKWKPQNEYSSQIATHVEFKDDDTFSYTSTKPEYSDYEEHGDYYIEDDKLYMHFSDENNWSMVKIVSLDHKEATVQWYEETISGGSFEYSHPVSYTRVSSNTNSVSDEYDGRARIDGIWYNLDSDNNMAQITYGKTLYTGNISIPQEITYDGITYKVNSIGCGAFANSKEVLSISLPNTIKVIEQDAFTHCTNLTSLNIPNSVITIQNWAFYGCTNLSKIVFGNQIKTIGRKIFAKCDNLLDVYCYTQEVPSADKLAFENCGIEYVTLHVPTNFVSKYKSTSPWNKFMSIIATSGSGIKDTQAESYVHSIYSIDGKKQNTMQKGINILRMSNGTTKKIIKK